MKEKNFFVETIFGAKTRQPLVRVTFDNKEIAIISPEQAQTIGQLLLQASAASLTDAFLFTFMTEHAEASDEEAAKLMHQFRLWRMQRETE